MKKLQKSISSRHAIISKQLRTSCLKLDMKNFNPVPCCVICQARILVFLLKGSETSPQQLSMHQFFKVFSCFLVEGSETSPQPLSIHQFLKVFLLNFQDPQPFSCGSGSIAPAWTSTHTAELSFELADFTLEEIWILNGMLS